MVRMDNPISNRFIYTILACMFAISLLGMFMGGMLGERIGLEMADIAERIVSGYGFASPYLPVDSGEPTRVSAPLYVGIISIVYYFFGIKSVEANTLLQLLNICFNAVSLILLLKLCEKHFGTLQAKVFSIMFVVQPHFLFIAAKAWETCLTMMLLSMLLYFIMMAYERNRLTHQIAMGGLLGLISLSNPAWTFSYPLLCILLYKKHNLAEFLQSSVKPIAIVFLFFCIVVSPWLVRNYNASGEIGFIRNMTSPEIYKGNNSESLGGHGLGFVKHFIYVSDEQRELYAELGEVAYEKHMSTLAKSEIANNPARYIALTVNRIIMWWSGDYDLVLWRYNRGETKEVALGVVFTIYGTIISCLAFAGTWRWIKEKQPVWPILLLVYFLPIPYYFMVVGFRYQSSLMAFTLIPASFFVAIYAKNFINITALNKKHLQKIDSTA